MPDKPKSDIPNIEDIPSLEDIHKSLGLDAMGFMSEMLSEPGDESKD